MYKSQFKKTDPYDWFCGPRSHIRFVGYSTFNIYQHTAVQHIIDPTEGETSTYSHICLTHLLSVCSGEMMKIEEWLLTCGDLLHELGGAVAALHQQVCPGGQIFSRVHSEQMRLHSLLSAQTQTERQLRVVDWWSLTRARVNQPDGDSSTQRFTNQQMWLWNMITITVPVRTVYYDYYCNEQFFITMTKQNNNKKPTIKNMYQSIAL